MKSLSLYISESQLNEVRGWTLEDDDWSIVNSKEDGRDLYAVRLWWGSGYALDAYAAFADNDEEALEYTVAWLEKNDPKLLANTDKIAEKDDEDERDESFYYVDATMVGAKEPHYVWNENMRIEKFPKNKYPKQLQ